MSPARAQRLDVLAAVSVAATIELQLWLGQGVDDRGLATLVGLVMAGAIAVRRRWPMAALLGVIGISTALDIVGDGFGRNAIGPILAALLGFYGAGAYQPEGRARVTLALGVGGLWADQLLSGGGVSDLAFTGIILGLLPWTIGRMMRERAASERAQRERAERLDAERERRAATAALHERARIARELHDVIAHSVSVMVIQAAGARIVMDAQPQRADASLAQVERAGREALAEMRRLLGVLSPGQDARELAPQPGVAELEELVARTCAAGLRTELRVEGAPAPLPPALDLCAYRVVQEALTNAIKHAGPARAEVNVRWAPDALELDVADDGGGNATVNGSGGGHGIAGMRERVALHGGTVEAGAGVGGGFAVHARLPLIRERVA